MLVLTCLADMRCHASLQRQAALRRCVVQLSTLLAEASDSSPSPSPFASLSPSSATPSATSHPDAASASHPIQSTLSSSSSLLPSPSPYPFPPLLPCSTSYASTAVLLFTALAAFTPPHPLDTRLASPSPTTNFRTSPGAAAIPTATAIESTADLDTLLSLLRPTLPQLPPDDAAVLLAACGRLGHVPGEAWVMRLCARITPGDERATLGGERAAPGLVSEPGLSAQGTAALLRGCAELALKPDLDCLVQVRE